MKAEKTEAWKCGLCGHVYPKNCRDMAEECCVCRRCNVNHSVYTGMGLCRRCFEEKRLDDAQRAYDQAAEALDQIKKELKSA